MSGPNDYDFDDDGRLRDISESWDKFQEEGERLFPRGDTDDEE